MEKPNLDNHIAHTEIHEEEHTLPYHTPYVNYVERERPQPKKQSQAGEKIIVCAMAGGVAAYYTGALGGSQKAAEYLTQHFADAARHVTDLPLAVTAAASLATAALMAAILFAPRR